MTLIGARSICFSAAINAIEHNKTILTPLTIELPRTRGLELLFGTLAEWRGLYYNIRHGRKNALFCVVLTKRKAGRAK